MKELASGLKDASRTISGSVFKIMSTSDSPKPVKISLKTREYLHHRTCFAAEVAQQFEVDGVEVYPQVG